MADTELWWQEAAVRQKEVEVQKPKGRKDFGKSEELKGQRGERLKEEGTEDKRCN